MALALVAFALLPACKSGASDAEIAATKTALHTINAAIDAYYVKMRELPNTLQDLVDGGSLEPAKLNDAWGRPFAYTLKGPRTFDLCSRGPDGDDAGDDVCASRER